MSRVLVLTGGLLFLWFFMPLMLRGMLNLGNVAGMLFSLIMLFGSLYYQVIGRGIAMCWQHGFGKVLCIVAAVVILAGFLTVSVAAAGIFRAQIRGQAPPETTCLVLGCQVKGSYPCTILRERIQAAYQYLTENPQAMAVLSGGQGPGEDITEARCMYRELTALGIAEDRLILEENSTDTRENVAFSGQLLDERGMQRKVVLITSDFHEYRAGILAGREGYQVWSYGTRTFWLYYPTYLLREIAGVVYTWLMVN